MSIDARQSLMNFVQRFLSDKMTVNEMKNAMDKFGIELQHYNIERRAEECDGVEFGEMLDAFLSAKKIEGRSKLTIERYKYVLERLRKETNLPIRDYTVFTLRGWLSNEQSRGIADRSLKGYREVFSSFFGWLYKEGLLNQNPCTNIGPIKCAKKVRTPYSDVDLERLKESCDCTRDRAMIAFLLSTGCRISEVCALNRDSINFHDMECTVHGKGNKDRTVFFDSVTAMLLHRYIYERTDKSEALFIGRGGSRLTANGARAMLKRIAERAHVENVHPHRFRRTLATNLIDHGMQIQEVASILGHEKLDTTLKYVYIDKNNVKNAYKKYA